MARPFRAADVPSGSYRIARVPVFLARIPRFLRRWWVDTRLPPPLANLLFDRVGAAVVSVFARVRRTHPTLELSVHELGIDNAQRVVEWLTESGVEPFLVEQRFDGFHFGVPLSDRDNVWSALSSRGMSGDWSIRVERGRWRSRSLGFRGRTPRGHTWRVFRRRSHGPQRVGDLAAVELSFWEPGSSGLLERIGYRGQHRFAAAATPTIEVTPTWSFPGRAAFPVARGLEQMRDPIDVVLTWVDGADPVWRAAFDQHREAVGLSPAHHSAHDSRYRSRDELRYLLRSLWAYAGWARRIHVVTAGQRPAWLIEDDCLRVVDHSEILPAAALPTFNSHSIEASLHRIPDLAEHFIYFNDDMLLGRPTRPETFFTANGLPKVFSSDAIVLTDEDDETRAADTAARRGRELLDAQFGRVVAHKPHHAPYALRVSSCEAMERDVQELIDQTRHSRFRSSSDLSVAASFAMHHALARGVAVSGELAAEYVHVESGRLALHLARTQWLGEFDAICINETESPGGLDDRERRISSFFETCYPVASPWERR